jgi:hypothetical protein
MLAPFNGMMVVGTYFEDPNVRAAIRIVFLIEYKDRYDRREISGSTIRNYAR